jgi:hypothetical protein
MPIARRRFLPAALAAVLVFSGALIVATAGPRAQNGGFVKEVADLPLMPGLREVKDAGVVFDKPDGRIVEAYAQGEVARAEVLSFYDKTLPQLGWRKAGAASFRREGENLSLDFPDGSGILVVRFTLTPE